MLKNYDMYKEICTMSIVTNKNHTIKMETTEFKNKQKIFYILLFFTLSQNKFFIRPKLILKMFFTMQKSKLKKKKRRKKYIPWVK